MLHYSKHVDSSKSVEENFFVSKIGCLKKRTGGRYPVKNRIFLIFLNNKMCAISIDAIWNINVLKQITIIISLFTFGSSNRLNNCFYTIFCLRLCNLLQIHTIPVITFQTENYVFFWETYCKLRKKLRSKMSLARVMLHNTCINFTCSKTLHTHQELNYIIWAKYISFFSFFLSI